MCRKQFMTCLEDTWFVAAFHSNPMHDPGLKRILRPARVCVCKGASALPCLLSCCFWLGLWADAFGGAAQSASMFIVLHAGTAGYRKWPPMYAHMPLPALRSHNRGLRPRTPRLKPGPVFVASGGVIRPPPIKRQSTSVEKRSLKGIALRAGPRWLHPS